MLRFLMALALMVVLLGTRCDSPRVTSEPRREPKPGEFVKMRGTLGEDVDCRLFRPDGGGTYSLSVKLPQLINGSKVCVHGTIAEVSQCLTTPMIEVTQVRPWSSCPQ
jgi:hypothetical protein